MKSDIEKTKAEILTYLPLIQQDYNIKIGRASCRERV